MNGKKILIVDDNPVIIKTLTMKLSSAGYEVMAAADGSEAVSMVRKGRPDLILLDINFPPDVAHGGGVAWDGFLIIQWLRRMDEVKDVPIIVISGGDASKYKDRSLATGAIGYFQKPIDNSALLEAVKQALPEKTATPPPI
jgi:CheY-like chemotaxis protein